MKRHIFAVLLLTLALILCAAMTSCNREVLPTDGKDTVDTDGMPKGISDPQGKEVHTDDEGDGHVHLPAEYDNVVAHEDMGYCGNTATEVSCVKDGESWKTSFEGTDSVKLTDLLLYLDYKSEYLCKCLPEYTVDTEFGTGYGINLTEGYARHEDGQTALTAEQVVLIREIIERHAA